MPNTLALCWEVKDLTEVRPHTVPDDLQQSISNDEHLPCHLSFSADQVTRCEDESFHFQHKVMKELRLTLLENGHLNRKYVTW